MRVSACSIKIQIEILSTLILRTVNEANVLAHSIKTKPAFWPVEENQPTVLVQRWKTWPFWLSSQDQAVVLTNGMKTKPTY